MSNSSETRVSSLLELVELGGYRSGGSKTSGFRVVVMVAIS